jgi:succinyl-diaminopimelate desuccinylase
MLAGALGPAETIAPSALRDEYRSQEARRLVPLLLEVLRFPTVAGDAAARDAQQQWLLRVGREMGFSVRDAGLVTEIELPGPPGAPVLGLVVHGDVQPANAPEWSVAPFAGVERDGVVWGRGSADDKGPLVQALLALSVLKRTGFPLTHSVRLLVGSDEESGSLDFASYLKTHAAPDLSLVLDSAFPVVVGEKAWNALTLTAGDPYSPRGAGGSGKPSIIALEAGLSPSIVPSRARAVLRWDGAGDDQRAALARRLRCAPEDGLSVEAQVQGPTIEVLARGRAAHSGVNIEGGRNALVKLAQSLAGEVQPSGAADLLAFAAEAGQDVHGSGLGLTEVDPLWGRYDVNVATVTAAADGRLSLTINLRRVPPRTGPQLRSYLEERVAAFQRPRRRPPRSRGLLRGRASRLRPRVQARPAPASGLRARHREARAAGDLGGRHLRQASSPQHRLRDVVSRKALPGTRRRRAHERRRPAPRRRRAARGARRPGGLAPPERALRPVVGLGTPAAVSSSTVRCPPLVVAAVLGLGMPHAGAGAEVEVRVAGERVNVRANAAPLTEILDSLSRQTGMKVVWEGAPARPPVTISVDNRTPAEAVLAILEGLGLNYALDLDTSGTRVRTLMMLGSARPEREAAPGAPTRPHPSFGVPIQAESNVEAEPQPEEAPAAEAPPPR